MSISQPLPPPSTQRVFRLDPTAFELREEHHRATFSATELPPSTLLVTIHGEIDATNSMALARYVEKRLAGARKLILDLQTVEFFAASGFAALMNINVVCGRTRVRWSLLAGPHVLRLLRTCDSARELPVAQASGKYSRTRPSDRKLLVGGNN
ncbi:anti-anti-sigma regulatory factor (antagonist of anti-sigma factor) [Mycolicibacterium chubuense NBB4]|uniref:Anti-anti-sigma regulatory factor (Antagonist of anti-sigma factor) n=1 Tax=Mycolicibacterium chubuense (strain NBB4) TaxID=710421 RepID=I4BDD7_MYCCN|nr:STAS domain-containing protein [Mycolicibacterium chubuense]AFM15294.1 anti-anti-sigma regulatory factor (antagonist of anti-sigma factor) [Mycolicibacterium chubuense NBB4]